MRFPGALDAFRAGLLVFRPGPRYSFLMSEVIFVVEEAPEGGFTARALGASIFTEADTMDELRDAVRDAVRCHFDEGAEQKFSLAPS